MNLNNYSYQGRGKVPQNSQKSIGAGYILVLVLFFIIFIVMAVLFIGMKKNMNKKAESNEPIESVSEDDGTIYYDGFKEIISDTFSDKAGYAYSVQVSPSEDNAYFLSDNILKKLTAGSEYSITGNIVEKGVSGDVYVSGKDSNMTFSYGFTPNRSLLTVDLTDYLTRKGEKRENVYEKGHFNNIELDDRVSGIEVMKAIEKAFLTSEIKDEKSEEGEYTAIYEKGSFNVNSGYKYIDRLFNDYPGEMTVSISTEESDNDENITYIQIEGPVTAKINLNEYTTLGNADSTIKNAYNFTDEGVFSLEDCWETLDLNEVLKEF